MRVARLGGRLATRSRLMRSAAGLVLFCAIVCGCQSSFKPDPIVMPDLEPKLPPSTVTLAWNHETVPVRGPVGVPPELIRSGYTAWARSGYSMYWPVRLPDGRTAVMLAGRFRTNSGLAFGAFSVSVYRPDGTLEIQEQNSFSGSSPVPLPNHPTSWTCYAPDGKTKALEGMWRPDASGEANWFINFYDDGKPSRQYEIHGDVVQSEWRLNEHGDQQERLHGNGY